MRRTVLLTLVTLVLVPAAEAQGPLAPPAHSFRVEWARKPPSMRPGVEGYVYNDSRWRVTNVRLRVEVVDAAGQVVRESAAGVFGDVIPRGRTFFVLPALAEGESYRLSVVSFDLVSQEGP